MLHINLKMFLTPKFLLISLRLSWLIFPRRRMGDVDAELAEVRELLAGGDDDPQEYYKVTVLGGRWTKEQT